MHFVYGFCDGNALAAEREYARRFPGRHHPNHRVFERIHRQLSENGRFNEVRERAPRTQARTDDRVLRLIQLDPTLSTRRIAQRLGIQHTMVWRIINRNSYHPYHRTPVQELSAVDMINRKNFCQEMLNKMVRNPEYISNILWTDEATFTKTGVTNYHNSHVWSLRNPHATRVDSSQFRFKVNVWMGIWRHQIIGPIILPESLNALNYVNLLIENVPRINAIIPSEFIDEVIYQQDGAPAHWGRISRNWLDQHYHGRWLGRGGPLTWPARSPDLTPLDFYAWGVMKNDVYSVEIQTQEELTERINGAAERLRSNLMEVDIAQAVLRRVNLCLLNDGNHFEQHL